jgi:hypothetical protein
MAEILEDFLDAFSLKLQSCSFIDPLKPENIMVGETSDWFSLDDNEFPRVEILITKERGSGYVDQNALEEYQRVSILGVVRRTTEVFTKDDMKSLIQFGRECKRLFFSFNTDAKDGTPFHPDFIQCEAFHEMFYEKEILPKHHAFEAWFDFRTSSPYVS